MTPTWLALRSFRHFALANILAVACFALSTAIICGSLIVGRSVRDSLRDALLSRLGTITHAVVSASFFPDDLVSRVSGPVRQSSTAILCHGTAAADNQAVEPNVNIIGIDNSFSSFYAGREDCNPSGRGACISRSLADALAVHVGDGIVATLARSQSAPLDSLFAHRSREGSEITLRLQIDRILSGVGPADFALDSAAGPPRMNLFVSRETLADSLGKDGFANTLLLNSAEPVLLRPAIADCGLSIATDPLRRWLMLGSDRLLLRAGEIDAASKAAGETGGSAARISVFLADRVHDEANGKSISYAIFSALEGFEPKSGDARLNQWAATDIAAHPGDKLQINCLTPRSDGTFDSAPFSFHVESLTAPIDSTLTPKFEGISDAARISGWNPPFPVDLSRVTARDEAYWTKFRAAPRAFVRLDDAQRYWSLGPGGQSTGWVTSIRITPPAGEELGSYRKRFEASLARRLAPDVSGLSLRPIRAIALKGAQGSTDFSDLFLSLGFFVILAASGAAATLMQLGIERRSSQIGLLKAIGFTDKKVSRIIVFEGVLIAAAGSLAGGPLGVLYGASVLKALAGTWSPAADGLALAAHPAVDDIAIGMLCGFVIGTAYAVLSACKILKLRTLELLASSPSTPPLWAVRSKGQAIWLGLLLAAAALPLFAGKHAGEEAFFASGFLLLVAGLVAASLVMAHLPGKSSGPLSIGRIARRNAGLARRQSLLILGLVASATFLLVAVAANTRRFDMRAAGDIQSGAGGFALVATSSLPIPGDFSTPAGRARLGFSAQDEAAMSGVSVYGLLVSPGENASCLNLAHPMAPKMLGVSHALIDRGGFGVDWQDLLKSDETAAFADADTGRWILDTDVGRKYEYRNGPVAASLRIRGLIPDSIFAGELLVSEDRFRRLFPDERTPRFFLIQTPTGHEDAVAAVLRQNLGVLGLDVRKSSDLLNAVASVQNTYISAFDALGGLGMLLGTGVLATMLLRRAAERRKELAILAALGFRQRSIAAILFYETAGLLVAGALWGAVCALVSITPYLTQSSAAPNWPVVCAITGMTTLVGAAGCYLAAISATHGSLVEALRSE